MTWFLDSMVDVHCSDIGAKLVSIYGVGPRQGAREAVNDQRAVAKNGWS
jgi:hypothetical protein